MSHASFEQPAESRVLAFGDAFALLSVSVPELSHTLLVQLVRIPTPASHLSLYSVYREGMMTFDAISRFEVPDRAPLVEVLAGFVQHAAFRRAVVEPLIATVRAHFKR